MSGATVLTQQAAAARLLAALRGRGALEDAARAALRRATAKGGADGADGWAAGALALLMANAGAACLSAFFRLDGDPAVLGRAGAAAAALCREAGASATVAALEGWERLGRPGWWPPLLRLAREAPDCVAAALAAAGVVLEAGGAEAFAELVALGLKASGQDRARRRRFFALDDPLARRAVARGGQGGFDALERRLKLFVTALQGRPAKLRPLPASAGRPPPRRASLADGVLLLPEAFPGVKASAQPALFRAAAAHAAAHLLFGAGRQPVGTLKQVQIVLAGLVEDARVEALMLRRFPGLRRLWGPFHLAEAEGGTAPVLLARLARGLFDPDHADSHGFVAKGRALFAAADLTDPSISRRIGGLLGNDLGQMRVQFNPRTYVIEPAYRDDNLGLWDFGDRAEASPDLIEMMVEAARRREEAGEGRTDPLGDPAGTAGARPVAAAASEEGLLLARYPEWDRALGSERPEWTTVREVPPHPGDPRRIDALLDGAPDLRRRIDRLVRAARAGRPQRLRRLPEGTDLDLDALLESVLAEAAGEMPDERVHRATALHARDLATAVLMDVSESTRAGGVLETERLAVALLGEAMQRLGDPSALLAFASDGRERVMLTRVKDFAEPFGPASRSRLAGLVPGLSTRLGAALRHAGAELAAQRSFRRLVLVLTDAEPSDIDVPDRADLVEDARRAVLRLRAQGTDAFGVILGPTGQENAARIFGRAAYVSLHRIADLPARLSDLYFRLSRR
jgi:nitric oxide reductase NorD protein